MLYTDVVMSSVAIVRGKHPSKMVNHTLKLIEAKELIKPTDNVLIKPNYVRSRHPSTGVTTDSRVVESVIEFVKNIGVTNIVVGEGGSGGNTEKAFDIVGIRNVVARQNVKLVNLNRDSRVNIKIQHPLALEEVGIAKTALKSTCIINVPTLKVHHRAIVTLCVKNLMGLIIPKPASIMHRRIHEKLVDLASLFKDKVKINIIDGLVGTEDDEIRGSPVEMNLVLTGRDMVAVDSIATAVMGIDSSKVKYLQLAEERGLGVANLNKIKVLGEKTEDVTRKFRYYEPTFNELTRRSHFFR